MAILSNINHGWCDFNLEDFYGRPSYITYVPMNILDAWEEYQNTGHCVINFDEEGSEFCVLVWNDYSLIIHHLRSGKFVIKYIDLTGRDLLRKLVTDVIINMDKWGKWCSVSSSKKSVEKITNELNNRIKSLGLD